MPERTVMLAICVSACALTFIFAYAWARVVFQKYNLFRNEAAVCFSLFVQMKVERLKFQSVNLNWDMKKKKQHHQSLEQILKDIPSVEDIAKSKSPIEIQSFFTPDQVNILNN